MNKQKTLVEYLAKLRARAEKQLNKKIVKLRRNSAGDLEKVLHELSVHQIELEMQNEQLNETQFELEKSSNKYADLYDFAPVGYFTIDKQGNIIEANLTGCQMLGVERSSLIKKPFHLFVDRDNKDDFYLHHKAALTPGVKLTCEITIVRKDKEKFQARLDSIPVIDENDNVNSCRTTITDISEQKHAQQQVINLAKFPAEDPFPVLRISEDGKIIYNNRPAESLLAEWQCEIWQKAPLQWRKIVSESLKTNKCRVIDVHCGETIFSITVAPVPESGYVNLYGTDITERKRAEEQLEQSEKKYRRLFDTMSEGFALNEIICDKKGKPCDYRFLEVNPAFEELTGLKVKNVVGKTIKEIIPEIEQYWIDTYGEVALTGKSKSFENFAKSLGKYYDVFAYRPEPGRFATVFVDITERKKAEEAIRIANERLVLAQQAAGAGLWDWNIETGNLEWSDQLFILFGLDPEKNEAGFDLWRSALHPDDRIPAEKRIETSIENHTQLDSEYRIILSSGEVRWIHCLGNTIYDDTGKPVRMSGICLDITESKKAEDALRQRTEELQTILDTTPVAIFMAHDPECRKITGNPAAQELVQLPPNANISKSAPAGERPTQWREMRDGVPLKPDELPLQRAAHGEEIRDYEMDMAFEDGTVKSVVGNATPIRNENNKPRGGIAILMDITERKKAEEEIRKSNEELSRFNKYAVGRELRMIELKKEINSLCEAIGQPKRYRVDFDKQEENEKTLPQNPEKT